MNTETRKRLNQAFRKALADGLQGCYAARWGVHTACAACGKLYPEMIFVPMMRDCWDASCTTRCCDAWTRDWRFVVGTRKKGKV